MDNFVMHTYNIQFKIPYGYDSYVFYLLQHYTN